MEGFASTTATSLFMLSLGAFAVPLLCKPVRLPASIGEIAYGVLVGPQVLHLVHEGAFLRTLAELGVLMLMFMAGLELDFRALEEAGIRPIFRSLGQVTIIFCFCVMVAYLCSWPAFVGLALATMSIGLLVALLQESGLMKQPQGQHWLLLGSLGEFTSILVATGVNAHYRAGGINAEFVGQFSQLGLVFLLAYLLLLLLRNAVWWKAEAFGRLVETHDPSEVGVRAGMALMFVFVAVSASLHIEPILGSFMAGALFSFVFRHRGPLELKFFGLANGFFVPVFFISVGLHFDLRRALQSEPMLFLQMLATMFAARFLAMVLLPRIGSSWKERMAGALLLTCPLTLMVVFADVGLRLQLLTQAQQSTLILLVIITAIVFPWIARQLVQSATES